MSNKSFEYKLAILFIETHHKIKTYDNKGKTNCNILIKKEYEQSVLDYYKEIGFNITKVNQPFFSVVPKDLVKLNIDWKELNGTISG